ncbi:hypothetical protein EX30DRAFT_66644 [Ascodesmis nigricans]|uniref:Uncharacterized protein n=1 Tax=Ascodesmis nigricans TaxID=341454 RepID=A0A4S2MU05_9PEZI|nr:hypothetical protein EX30DRAFT_66644 [Ascodesmis nigricans]
MDASAGPEHQQEPLCGSSRLQIAHNDDDSQWFWGDYSVVWSWGHGAEDFRWVCDSSSDSWGSQQTESGVHDVLEDMLTHLGTVTAEHKLYFANNSGNMTTWRTLNQGHRIHLRIFTQQLVSYTRLCQPYSRFPSEQTFSELPNSPVGRMSFGELGTRRMASRNRHMEAQIL